MMDRVVFTEPARGGKPLLTFTEPTRGGKPR
jgi:hypothetical protein